MGGKTQQRVAGNAKPTSSSRIRNLMMDKKQDGLVGNIITFSALSNSPKFKTNSKVTQAEENSQDEPKKTGQSMQEEQNIKSQETMPASSSMIRDDQQQQQHPTQQGATKPTLVVRRIGDRDYFTRVRLPQDATSLRDQSVTIINNPAGTIKGFASESITKESKTIIENENEDDLLDPSDSEEDKRSEVSNSDSEVDDDDDDLKKQDFDTILAMLTSIQDECERRNTLSCLADLSQIDLEQERRLIKILKILITNFKEDLSIEEWDLLVRSIYKWCSLITKTDHLLQTSSWTTFCKDVFGFISLLIDLAQAWTRDGKDEESDEATYPMMNLLLTDWNNFHSSNVYQDLIILYFKLISSSNPFSQDNLIILEALAAIIVEVDPKMIIMNGTIKDYLSSSVEFDPEFKVPSDGKYCEIDASKYKAFIPICGLMKSNCRIILVVAHSMLAKVMPEISLNACEALEKCRNDLDIVTLMPPAIMMSNLVSKDLIMSALLSDYKAGDIFVTIEQSTDAYTCTLSYLLTWDLIIHFIVGLDKEDQHRIVHCLKKLSLLQNLLDTIFMLLPPLGERDSLRFDVAKEKRGRKEAKEKTWSLIEYLKAPLATNLKRPKNEIELIALHLYFSIALYLPVTVRKWYNNNSNKRLCNLVNEYTVKHISQVICSLEMEMVQERCQERASEYKDNNLIIKARPNAREVYAIYTRDEFKMELTIKLPLNYPLGSVQIDGGKRVGVTDLKWRSWLLQLTTFLSHQNGQILDGIDLWRRNIDKRFEGIEKCMICFSILHSNYQLPKKKCTTCTKMFHNLCLYKWFESSGNSTCPLCRNTW